MIENSTITTGATVEKRVGRWHGLTVFASVALPILVACIIFYSGVGMPTKTLNQGELLLPAHSIDDIDLWGEDSNKLDLSEQKSLWRYLILSGAECATDCEKLLYTSRQVHVRLGEKAARVERLLVTNKLLSNLRRQEILQQHPRLKIFTSDSEQIKIWLSDSSHAEFAYPNALLVDQQGFTMMVYDNRNSGNQLLKDIKRLLKYSYQK